MKLRILALLGTALAAAPLAAQQQQPNWQPSPLLDRAVAPLIEREASSSKVVTTRHKGVFNGKRIAYRAIVTELPLAGKDGTPAAVAVSFAYVAEGADPAARPVMFVFNGGPGASSLPLHMQAFGPKRITGKGTPQVRIGDNVHSLLDVTDLVFIDPVGTGISTPIKGQDASPFWGNEGDAKSVLDVINRWIAANGRAASPKIVLGESYGTQRALAILNEDKTKTLSPDGVALFSLAIGNGAPPVGAITLLPTLAAVAWYHQKIDRAGRTAEQYFAEVRAFAQTEYATALIKGDSLPAPERRKVAERISALIGLPVETIEKANLMPSRDDFMLGLLADKGLRTGQLDGRPTRAITESNFRPPFDDPSMTLGTDSSALFETYLKDELGYAVPSPYRSLNLAINSKWNRADSYASANYAGYAARAMKANPNLLLLSMGGYYDITTPTYAGEYVLDHAGIPKDRHILHGYAAGHSVFEDDTQLIKLSADMRDFVAQVLARKAGK